MFAWLKKKSSAEIPKSCRSCETCFYRSARRSWGAKIVLRLGGINPEFNAHCENPTVVRGCAKIGAQMHDGKVPLSIAVMYRIGQHGVISNSFFCGPNLKHWEPQDTKARLVHQLKHGRFVNE